jgi:hypothetical protein
MSRHQPPIADAAKQLIDVTARAWQVRPESPHALARRAPHGYVPQRLLRRRMHGTAESQACSAQAFSQAVTRIESELAQPR